MSWITRLLARFKRRSGKRPAPSAAELEAAWCGRQYAAPFSPLPAPSVTPSCAHEGPAAVVRDLQVAAILAGGPGSADAPIMPATCSHSDPLSMVRDLQVAVACTHAHVDASPSSYSADSSCSSSDAGGSCGGGE